MKSGDITVIEKEMLGRIAKAQKFTVLEADELYYAYKYISAQGIAAKTDLEEIARLRIPIYEALAKSKSKDIEEINELILAGSITSEEVKTAIFQITSMSSDRKA